MTRFAHRAILVLGALSFGVLAAPTAKPHSTQTQALQSCNPPIDGLPAAQVNVLEARGDRQSRFQRCDSFNEKSLEMEEELREETRKVAEEEEKKLEEVQSGMTTLRIRWLGQCIAQTSQSPTTDGAEAEWKQIAEEYRLLSNKVRSLSGYEKHDSRYREIFKWLIVNVCDAENEALDAEDRARTGA
ncbi:hypothetical protein C8R42DRAFT_637114 [Lentinula raphanica]|nr:hypothetical protein C8R42DRAFT_637114 [Lentinula raphanica]